MSDGTTVLSDEVIAFIESCKANEHPESYLIPVLQKVQSADGYLSVDAMNEVSYRMRIPSAKVTGVATFYHIFSFKPRGRHIVTLCMGTACFVRGAEAVLKRFKDLLGIDRGETTPDGEFSIECARCLGACALAPVVLVNDKVYGNVKPEDVPRILAEHGFAAAAATEKAKETQP